MRKRIQLLHDDLSQWQRGWYHYLSRKLRRFGTWFETNKDVLVDILMARRGGYQRPFLHFSVSVLVLAAIIAAPILATAYPGGMRKRLLILPPICGGDQFGFV